MPSLIDAASLAGARAAGRAIRLLDVRWRLDLPEGRPAYLAGHLPGAVYVDLESELARRGRPEQGRHPLPDPADLAESLRRWGIRSGDLVVAYDDNDGVAASRAWWLLRRTGIDIRVLDGGIDAWLAAGLPFVGGDVAPARGDVELVEADLGAVTAEEIAAAAARGIPVVDVRSPDHYRGRTAGAEHVAGHIPGAINIPTVLHIAADGRLRAPEEIRATLASHGIRPGQPVVLYCGSGIASAHSALAYATVGIEADIYAGSWSQWSQTRGRAIAVGASPSDSVRAW